jgi:hypothetical protein
MSNNSSSSGIGLPTILFIVFLVLKLTNYIDWSWWWVTSPLWISAILYIILIVVIEKIFR